MFHVFIRDKIIRYIIKDLRILEDPISPNIANVYILSRIYFPPALSGQLYQYPLYDIYRTIPTAHTAYHVSLIVLYYLLCIHVRIEHLLPQ